MSDASHNTSQPLAIITGAARGIGAAIAQRLSDAHFAVALWDYNGADASERARELADAGRRAIAAAVDVADEDQVEAAAREAEATFGVPYLLVNNAGIRHREPLETLARSSWDREIATNLTGPFVCTQVLGRRMARCRSRGHRQYRVDGGHIRTSDARRVHAVQSGHHWAHQPHRGRMGRPRDPL